jgi:hypothetical protein
VQAVLSDPVSAENSLLTGKIQGKTAISGNISDNKRQISKCRQCFGTVFPTTKNREFSFIHQGYRSADQGKRNQLKLKQRDKLNMNQSDQAAHQL